MSFEGNLRRKPVAPKEEVTQPGAAQSAAKPAAEEGFGPLADQFFAVGDARNRADEEERARRQNVAEYNAREAKIKAAGKQPEQPQV